MSARVSLPSQSDDYMQYANASLDAISLLGTGTVLIQGGGANAASDKVVQANGKGTTTIKDYTVVGVGKVFRSCGNCSVNGGPRNVRPLHIHPPSSYITARLTHT